MTITMTSQEEGELWDEIAQSVVYDATSEPFEFTHEMPKKLGRGGYRGVQVHPEIWLAIMDYQYHDDVVIQIPEWEHPLQFGVLLSGSTIDQYGGKVGEGYSCISGSGIQREMSLKIPQTRRVGVDIHMSPDVLRTLFPTTNEEILPQLRLLAKGDDWQTLVYPKITPTIQGVVQQIMNCPYDGVTKRMYLQGKVLELMTLQLLPILSHQGGLQPSPKLKSGTIASIHHAREILHSHLENPPLLVELAQMVGINVRLSSRGFQINDFFGNTLRNGIKDVGATTGAELSGIERIEVFQGPASVLFGGAAPGGTINFVTKQPLRDRYYSVEANIGSYDFYRGAVDISGPLDDDKKVLYRLNASYKDQSFTQDFTRSRVLVVAPVISFAIGENTKLTLEADYVDSTFDQIDLGLPLIGTVLPNPNGQIPRNRNTNEGVHTDSGYRVGYALEHQLSNNWSLKNAFRFGNMDFRNRGVTVGTRLLPDNRTLQRSYTELDERLYDEFNLTTDVVGKFSTGSINHQLLVGVELRRVDLDTRSINRVGVPIDLFNPIYGQPPGAITSRTDTNTVTDQLGVYLQDQVAIAENLKLLLGARFDVFNQTNQNFLNNTETSQSGDSFSPRVGIVYQPIVPISLYASYSQSFNPVIGTAFDGSVFQPEQGTQYEVGVKADLSSRLSATLAFYDLTRTNVVTTDTRPDVPLGFSIQTGEQRSQGIEFNIAGEILPGWNIFASYAYTDLSVTKDNVLPVGSSLNGVAKNAASLWTTYQIQQGKLQGLGFGLGLFYVGERTGFLDDTYELPSYLTTDAAIYYKQDRFRAALNFKNLFNVDYFENSFGRLRVSYGAPFTVQGTISFEF